MSKYFVSNTRGDDGQPIDATYWRARQGFGGLVGPGDSYERLRAGNAVERGSDPYHTNLNLLAHAVGDSARRASLGQVVPTRPYAVRSGLAIDLQPYALDLSSDPADVTPVELVIGSKLKRFLDAPLASGRALNLCLPFFDEDVVLGPNGGWLRPSGAKTFHGGFDFSTIPRRIFPVAASQQGVVIALLHSNSPNQRGLVVEHDLGTTFRTIYQHLDEESVVLAVGDAVAKGQELGQIRRQIQDDGDDNSHLHFAVAVHHNFVHEGTSVGALWYFIDPFGVYDYRDDDETYVPRTQEGMWKSIRGAQRSIHWSSEVPAESLPIERITEPYKAIRRFQVRVRRNDRSGGDLPPEHDQCMVWLSDDAPFFVPIRQGAERSMELELVETLRQAFMNKKHVRLAYRYVGKNRLITAAWVQG